MPNWENEWQAAKQAFETKTGQKKPSEKTMLGIRKGTGLEEALKKCDAFYKSAEGASKDPAKQAGFIKQFQAAIQVFDAKATAYERLLLSAIQAADSKLVKPELDVLHKNLASISATMKAYLKTLSVAAEGAKSLEFTAKTLVTNLAGGIARARLFASKVKSAKDLAVFNAGIMKASRDITQYIGNVQKLREKGYVFPHGDPTNLFKVLTPWAQGNRSLKPTADEAMVKREIGAFLQAVDGVDKWVRG